MGIPVSALIGPANKMQLGDMICLTVPDFLAIK